MKTVSRTLASCAVIVAVLGAFSCSGGGSPAEKVERVAQVNDTYTVKDAAFTMVKVPGGTLTVGIAPSGIPVKGADKNLHQALLDGFAISQTPVSQKLYKAVMGKNPSATQSDDAPVTRVSYSDARKFAAKLSKAIGVPVMIPSEAMWEWAMESGAVKPVEGAREWTSDEWGAASTDIVRNPEYLLPGKVKVVRKIAEREEVQEFVKGGDLTFRVAVRMDAPVSDEMVAALITQKPSREHTSANEVIECNGVKFQMVGVEGGTYTKGATEVQGQYADDNEKPATEVTVEGFEIGRTEVTVAQWKAVMGNLPFGNNEKEPNKPVINVSWYAAQEFILKLNSLTGRSFRLPTEDEWEWAANGGVKSRGCRFSGSNDVGAVAAYHENTADGKVVPVALHQANELGIYDMSGNAWEWCQDYFGAYGKEVTPSEWHMMRGGSAASPWNACRVSNRSKIPAVNTKGTFGFRLAI